MFKHRFEIFQVVSKNTKGNNLFFSLKGAGSSYGIVTEFLYRIYPVPETLPAAVPSFITTLDDLEKVKKINEAGRFEVSLFRLFTFRRLALSHEQLVS